MSLHPLEHCLYKLRNAPILKYPFPHFYAQNVFPSDFFETLLASLGGDDTYTPLPGGYNARAASSEMPECMNEFTANQRFAQNVLQMFEKAFYERFPDHSRPKFRSEWRFIRDSDGYAIGPHTDAPHKVVSLLFYLQCFTEKPEIGEVFTSEYGTGIYVPEDGQKTCIGGPHHKFEGFREVWRAPFFRNSCFGFFKTDNSWHAVEQIHAKIRRDVLLFNIYAEK